MASVKIPLPPVSRAEVPSLAAAKKTSPGRFSGAQSRDASPAGAAVRADGRGPGVARDERARVAAMAVPELQESRMTTMLRLCASRASVR
jgi:hypothetical protein